jgi:hypothetical protein
MTTDDVDALRKQAAEDRRLIQKAERVLAEIDRSEGLSDEHADVLAALRLRIEGKPRASLEDLLEAAGDISGKRDLKDLLSEPEKKEASDWPEVKETKRDWPGSG